MTIIPLVKMERNVGQLSKDIRQAHQVHSRDYGKQALNA